MFSHLTRSAYRNLWLNKTYLFIQFLGLTTGITLLAFSYFYIHREQSFDRFYPNNDRIFRVELTRYTQGVASSQLAAGCTGIGQNLTENFGEVEAYAKMMKAYCILRFEDKVFKEDKAYLANEQFFKVFGINLIEGNPLSALERPYTIVLSKSIAKKYFGNQAPIGKTMKFLGFMDLEVTGIYDDLPIDGHMHPGLLISMETFVKVRGEEYRTSWFEDGFYTYILLKPSTYYKEFESKLPSLVERLQGNRLKELGQRMIFTLQPITAIHLDSHLLNEHEENGNRKWLIYLSVANSFIVLMLLMNYTNLHISKTMEAGREVLISKLLGSTRLQLFIRFFIEAFILTFSASFSAFLLVWVIQPGFTMLTDWKIEPGYFLSGARLSFFLLIPLALSLCASIYPCFILFSLNLATGMKGRIGHSPSGITMRKTLVGLQFFISLIMFIASVGMYGQMNFLRNQPKGFDDQNIMAVSAPGLRDSLFKKKFEIFKIEASKLLEVKGVATTTEIPGRPVEWEKYHIRDIKNPSTQGDRFTIIAVDESYVPLFKFQVIAGNNFSKGSPIHPAQVLINERATTLLGYDNPSDALDQLLVNDQDTFLIKGVVKNFRQEFSKKVVEPQIIWYYPIRGNYFCLKYEANSEQALIASVKTLWDKMFPLNPYEYTFLRDVYEKQFKPDLRQESVIEVFTMITLVISSLGLFGLSSYMALRRSQEIGVRKVLGASSAQNLWLLCKEYFLVLGIAIAFGVPASWWLLNDWLAQFPLRVSLGLFSYLVPILGLMLIGFLSISYHVLRAVNKQVTLVLRHE